MMTDDATSTGAASSPVDREVRPAALLLACLLAACGQQDATDSRDGSRSGMWLRIDYGTGCEYLEGYRGGITPRLDAEGRHMGCRKAPA